MRPPRITRPPGFTLIEALIVTAILALVLLSLFQLFGEGYQGQATVSTEETITGTDNTAFTIRTWVQIVAGTAAPRREATLTVTTLWTEPTGGKTVRLDTLVAE